MVEPEPSLHRALTTLDEGEEWLLEPKMLENNPHLWSPGVKLGIKPGGWFHKTECFGPVLGLICAHDLNDAMTIQNDSDFGLTGGIHTLDDREIKVWRAQVEVGNAYINRPITGAIVQRQPFGGWKNSCFGPGAKAGGPNYVSIFASWEQVELPTARAELSHNVTTLLNELKSKIDAATILESAAASFAYWYQKEFSIEHDPSQLHGETNHFRYVPLKRLLVRADGFDDTQLAVLLLAAATAGVITDVSVSSDRCITGASCVVESDSTFAARLVEISSRYSSLRAPGASEVIRRAANAASLQLTDWKVLLNGRIELTHYFREQSISECTHRYGNIIPKPGKVASI
jgi:RHH-type proline utilization regulon transcriptional repressor/proline dehydrogenase/delta 1-pyrroline-5-carboxylate dehydrogenase